MSDAAADRRSPESSSTQKGAGLDAVALERFIASIQSNPDGSLVGDFVVLNTMGLHVRPATNLALASDGFGETEIWLVKEGVEVSAKEALLILTLAGVSGTPYQLKAKGAQAREALETLFALAARKFDVIGD